MGREIDLTGQRFGRLTVVKKVGVKRVGQHSSKSIWLCRCDCGNEKEVLRNSLVNGGTKSCGCLAAENRKIMHLKHGKANTRIWKIWCNMRDRCGNPNNRSYPYYGGRGIVVCEEWKNDFTPFYNWAVANGYSDEMTIDRIDGDGNYEPSNCRWATRKDQTRNRGITRKFTLSEIAEIEGISYQRAYDKFVRRKSAIDNKA